MQRCIELASLAAGNVAPNPMVGSVLVHKDRVIGEGYHKLYGQVHAEVNCIRDARRRFNAGDHPGYDSVETLLQESTIYVSLEPCAHFGKTPPCADLIIEKKIPNVVIGCRDPFEAVNGKGIEKLIGAGIKVRTGILEQQCKLLNKRFFTFHTKKRPYIILKWAQSADSKIAGIDSARILISNEFTNRLVHKWRSEEASILVGTNTALVDNPSLTNRLWSGNNPTRLLVDLNLRLPGALTLFDKTVQTIVFNIHRSEVSGKLVYYQLEKDMPLASQICDALYKLNIQSVIVEGGAVLLQSFLNENLWDEARIVTNEALLIGAGLAAPSITGASLEHSSKIFTDIISVWINKDQ